MIFEKKQINVNGRKVFYWEKNPKQKETIVLLHGYPGSHGGLLGLANGLGNYRLIIPDLPACGLSEPLVGKHNLKNYSNWLDLFFNSLKIKRPIILGHSFGARLAMVFSVDNPERIKKIVLVTPVSKVEGLISQAVSMEYEIAKILPKNYKKAWLFNGIYRGVGNMILFKSVTAKRKQQLIAKSNKDIDCLDPEINIELFDEFYKFSLIPLAKKIKIESLIIAGELDEIAPLNSVRELAKQLVDSEFVVMKGAGHVVVVEKPLTVAGIIRKWLR